MKDGQADDRRSDVAQPRARVVVGMLLAVLITALGCPPPNPDAGTELDAGFVWPGARERCTRSYTAFPEPGGELADPELVETSGIAASALREDLLWMHNDSGDGPRLFATRTDGAALGRLTLSGAELVDAEDLSIALCPDGEVPCLWVADTGDNLAERDDAALYVLPEPTVPDEGLGEATAASFQRIPLEFEGGAVDVEAMAVEADGGRVWFIEKIDEIDARVFMAEGPFQHGVSVEAQEVATVASPGVGTVNNGLMITAASLHGTGRQLVMRLYTGVYEYRFDDGKGVESISDVEPVLVTLGPFTEPQGEAITYDFTGLGLWSVSEDVEAMPGQPLHHYDCE